LARRSTTLVATHYPELKAFAHVTVGVRNASVEFDLDTLEPTYHLTVGLPGRSNALSIAARLGLEGRILDRARGWVEPEELQAESLLDEIHRQREAARESRARADEALTAAAASREELEARLEAIAQERREVLESAREEGRRELEALREQLAGLRRELRAARQPLEKLEEIQAEVEQLEEAAAEPTAEQRPSPAEPPGPFRVGDRVRMEDIDMTGVIKALSSEDAEIQVGRLRVRAQLDRLRRVEGPAPKEERSGEPSREAVRTSKPAPPMELDLRGQRVEGALEELDRRLDAAYLAGMPFLRVIHGKGTGRLRQAVRQALGGSRYVASFEPGLPGEGGNGVTVVKMAES
jgi:DNA mismatch repair protein MutS2